VVESPCTYECHVIEDQCIKCKRTVDEVINWIKLTDTEKESIIERIKNQN